MYEQSWFLMAYLVCHKRKKIMKSEELQENPMEIDKIFQTVKIMSWTWFLQRVEWMVDLFLKSVCWDFSENLLFLCYFLIGLKSIFFMICFATSKTFLWCLKFIYRWIYIYIYFLIYNLNINKLNLLRKIMNFSLCILHRTINKLNAFFFFFKRKK